MPRHLPALLTATALAALLAPSALAAPVPKDLPVYQVGVGVRDINPNRTDGTWDGKPIYLGGYGLSGGTPVVAGRPAKGIVGDGLHVRAMVIGDGKHTIALADAELQGWFAATRDGAYGIIDVRKAVEKATGGALKASDVVVQSDHSHSGPDLIGPWGGAPAAYRNFVVQQTTQAILDAWKARRPGTLWYGTTKAGVGGADGLLNNQFDYDPANKAMDDELRVLQARDPQSGHPFATMLNLSAHATVLGSQPYASGDWPAAANPMMEQAFGGQAMTVVGTVGRSQPNRGGDCPGFADASSPAASECKIEAYAARVVAKAREAVDAAQPITGDAKVDSHSYLIEDPATSPFLLALLYGGNTVDGAPLNRSITPPWMTGDVLGTSTTSMRIGDVLMSTAPGEMYPQIALKVRELAKDGIRGYMTAGLADDQLGYLIAPFEAYPEPIKRSLLDTSNMPSPIDNDNYMFNVSHTIGERVTCSLLRGAGELFPADAGASGAYSRCALFATDAAIPADSDVTQPIPTAPALPPSPPAAR